MMKVRLVPENKTKMEELIVDEKSWRPARSLMAIANQKYLEQNGELITSFIELKDLDENIGHGLNDTQCKLLAAEMQKLLGDPFGLVDYGMTVDIVNGNTFYTYPTDMCTGYVEDVIIGSLFVSLDEDDIVGKRVRSWFRTSEAQMKEIIEFLQVSGGFTMP